MRREEKEDLLREAVDTLIKLDIHLMTSRDKAEFSAWVEDLIDSNRCSVLEDIKAEIKQLCKEPARYVPNYDAYERCYEIIDKHISGKEQE